jgi:multidrug efflux pump subunit AcrB
VLQNIFIRSPLTGEQVPFSSFAYWNTAPTKPLAINHQSMFPSATISFNLAPGAALGDAVLAIQQAQRDMVAPGSLISSFQGNAQAFQASLVSVPLLVIAALVVVYIVLGILYESFIHPLTILSTLPSAGFGALVTLWAFGYDFSVVAMIGVILLIGIVKKNGIMLVDFAIAAERHEGKAPEQAIREACLLRFRPILMTTAAALLSGLPLMLGNGTGSEMRQPLGYAMVGGLAFSQVFTLYTTPVVYLYLSRFQRRLFRRAARAKELPTLPLAVAHRPAKEVAMVSFVLVAVSVFHPSGRASRWRMMPRWTASPQWPSRRLHGWISSPAPEDCAPLPQPRRSGRS